MPGPEPGQPMLKSMPLADAATELGRGLASAGVQLHPKVLEALARRTVRAYIFTERISDKIDKRVSPMSISLSQMTIGEVMPVDPTAPQVIRARMTSARRIMRNPIATWVCHTEAGRTLVTRKEDGARPTKNPRLNGKADFMACLQLDHAWVRAPLFLHRRMMSTNTKVTARKIMNDPDADWSVQMRRDGVYIRRTK